MIDIKGLDKAKVLLALYEGSHELGMSSLGRFTDKPTLADCRKHLEASMYVDYFNGRVIKVDLKGETINEAFYDRDCGAGACAAAIDSIR